MEIKQIYLKHFRNYDEGTATFSPGINVFIGDNGQGKTNILEGIYYLATGKSYRVQRERELVQWGKKEFVIKGNFLIKERKVELESQLKDKKKVITINKVPCKKLSEFVGTVNIVFFSPDDLVLVKGGPTERRRFLDLHIAQMRPSYISILNQYNKVMQQKNALLKSNLSHRAKINQLSLWNDQLVPLGAKIITYRWELALRLQHKAELIFENLSHKKELLNICYVPLGEKNVEEALKQYPVFLEEKMEKEIERQTVLVGPHRDDLIIEFNNRSGRLYGSQGQQRSLVLSLKLAELELMHEQNGEYPLLLLDDVLSELDGFRREYLMSFIESSLNQTLITMTSAEGSILKKGSSIYRVSKGNLFKMDI